MPVMQTGVKTPAIPESLRQAEVLETQSEGSKTTCILSDGGRLLVSTQVGAHICPGDQIDFPVVLDSTVAGTEIYIHKTSPSRRIHDIYQAPISYAAQPKSDKREQLYVRAEIPQVRLGIFSLHFPCEVLRDYFYVADRRIAWERQKTFYEVVRISTTASPAELRLAFKLRTMELRAENAPKAAFSAAERAFNMPANPELRACYDSLLSNHTAPVLFPYGGFGSIIVLGDRSRDGQTFLVRRIVSFLPESRQLHFRAPLRKFDFSSDSAVYRDPRRRLEVPVDQSAMPIVWDQTWNQWKQFLGTQVEIKGAFVEAGKYRRRGGEWQLVKWQAALPSHLAVRLPASTADQVEPARMTY